MRCKKPPRKTGSSWRCRANLRITNDDSLMLHQEWVAECVSRGLFIASHHNHFINAALTDEDIALAADIANDAFSVVAKHHPDALRFDR